MELLNKIKIKLKLAKNKVQKRYLYTLQKPVQDMTLNEMADEISVKKMQLLQDFSSINDRDMSIIKRLLSFDLKQNIRNSILIDILKSDENVVPFESKKAFISKFIDIYSSDDILDILNSDINNKLKFEIVFRSVDKVPEQILIDFVDPYNINIDFTKRALKSVSVIGKEKILNKIYNKSLQKKLFFEITKSVDFGEKEKLYKDTLISDYKDLEEEYISQIKSKSGYDCLECIKSMEYITPEIAKVLDEKIEVKNINNVIDYINNNEIKQGAILYLCRKFNVSDKISIFNNVHNSENRKSMFEIIKNDLSQNELNEILKNNNDIKSTYIPQSQNDELYEKIHTYSQKFDVIADCFFRKFYHIDYKTCRLLVSKYGYDLDELINIYRNKSNLTDEENKEFNNLLLLKNIKEDLNISDKKELLELYDKCDKSKSVETGEVVYTTKSFHTHMDCIPCEMIDETMLKDAYCREYVENLYSPEKNENSYKELKYNNKNIQVYSPLEFNLFTFAIGLFNNFNILDKNCNMQDKWKEFLDNNDFLHTCFSNNNNICTINNKDTIMGKNNIIIGFSNLHKYQIKSISPYNLCSSLKTIKINSGINEKFFVMKNFINNFRGNLNEVVLEKNIQPSYVVCYNKISDESKKFASDFEIPIVFIDVKNIAKNEARKLDDIYLQFIRTKKSELLEKYVCEYQNNINGLRAGFQNIMKKYFSPKAFEQKIDNILQDLENGIINKNKHSYECLDILKQSIIEEQRKYEYNISEELLYSNNIDIKKILCKIDGIKRKLLISSVEMNNGNKKEYGLKNVLSHTTDLNHARILQK